MHKKKEKETFKCKYYDVPRTNQQPLWLRFWWRYDVMICCKDFNNYFDDDDGDDIIFKVEAEFS